MYETRQHKEATSRGIQKPEGKRGQMFQFKDNRKEKIMQKNKSNVKSIISIHQKLFPVIQKTGEIESKATVLLKV